MAGQRPKITRDATIPRRAASAPVCRRHAWLKVSKSAQRDMGRSGATCSAVPRGARPARRGGLQADPWRASAARSLAPTPRAKQKRGQSPLGHISPRSAMDRMSLPATQMIQHPHIHQRQSCLQRLRQVLIGPRRLGRTTRVVVHQQRAAELRIMDSLTTSRG
jgi:hypothetical protein